MSCLLCSFNYDLVLGAGYLILKWQKCGNKGILYLMSYWESKCLISQQIYGNLMLCIIQLKKLLHAKQIILISVLPKNCREGALHECFYSLIRLQLLIFLHGDVTWVSWNYLQNCFPPHKEKSVMHSVSLFPLPLLVSKGTLWSICETYWYMLDHPQSSFKIYGQEWIRGHSLIWMSFLCS